MREDKDNMDEDKDIGKGKEKFADMYDDENSVSFDKKAPEQEKENVLDEGEAADELEESEEVGEVAANEKDTDGKGLVITNIDEIEELVKLDDAAEKDKLKKQEIDAKEKLRKKLVEEKLGDKGEGAGKYGGDGGDGIIEKSVATIMHESMIPYSEFVILDRALPRVEDGLKPVQRRILFAMNDMGLLPDKPFRKSAGIVGECLGKYHPHGDVSVYDAMVRLAQPFNMNMPLINGQGNFGSDDGDGAAAMRYTEARLSPLALELLRDIDKETVPFSLTYDDRNTEPDILPARYPNLLTNGVSGIAVGLATNIPPHNLGELIDAHIAWIDNNRITLKEILKIIKGPDFPTGGYILNNDELVNAYATGKGKCQMSAKIHIEVEGDKRSIVIDEVPYQVNKVQLQRNIADMRETKKGLETIQAITDESDRNGTRVIIRLKKDGDARSVVKLLYKYTQLQCNFNFNMVAIANGKPRQMTLMQIIEYYCLYQRDIIYKRSVFELRKAKERAHIIEGLLIAIKNIDEVIKIIKTSKHTTEARERLQKTFNLSERQAQAILDLRLARLTSLEVFKLKEELDELLALIEKLSKVIASKRLQFDIVKEEMLDIKKRFKSLIGRRTTVLRPEEEIPVPSSDDTPPTENIKISISEDGRLKKGAGKGAVMTIKTETDKLLYVFTHNGMVHKMMGYELPDVTKFDGEKIISVLPTEPDKSPEVEVVWLSKTGMIKRSAFADAFNVQKDTYQCCKLREDKPDEIINVQILNKDDTILMVTNSGNVLNARTNDIPLQGRIAAGVKGIKLEEDEFLFYHSVVNSQDIITVKTTNNREIKVNVKDIPKMKRYGKGQLLIKNLKKNEMITMIMDKG